MDKKILYYNIIITSSLLQRSTIILEVIQAFILRLSKWVLKKDLHFLVIISLLKMKICRAIPTYQERFVAYVKLSKN